MEKVLITGGAGFIGSHLTSYMVKRGYEVYVLDNLSNGKRENVGKGAFFIKGDITAPNIEKIFQKHQFKAVFHLAAQIDVQNSIEHPMWDAKTNILGSINVFNLAGKYGVKNVVFSSSGGAIYGESEQPFSEEDSLPNINNPYGASKLAVETYLEYFSKKYQMNGISLRYSNVYGPKQGQCGEGGVVYVFIDKMLKREDITIYGGDQTRDFIYVGDIVMANFLAMDFAHSAIFNISTAKETSINDLFNYIAMLLSYKKKPIYKERKFGDVERSCLGNNYANDDLKWEPLANLSKGLDITITDYLRSLV